MSYEVIFSLMLMAMGFLGMGVIIFKKIFVLVNLPEIAEEKVKSEFKPKEEIVSKDKYHEKFFNDTVFKIKTATSKTEIKAAEWIKNLRKMTPKGKAKKQDNYWEEIKKSTKN